MKVAVIGAQGFIGSNVCNSLRIAGNIVTSFTNVSVDNTCYNVRKGDFDWILNFAGKTSISESYTDSVGVYNKNIEIALAAMQIAASAGAVLLHASSYVYGGTEQPAIETDQLFGANPYMGSKIATEKILTDLSNHLNVGLVTIRPSNIYGYGQRQGMLISSLIQSAKDHNEVVLNDAAPKRDYLYIADFCRLIGCIVGSGHRMVGETFNVGSGVTHRNYEVAEAVRRLFSIKLPVKILGNRRTADILDASVNITKIQATVDWKPQYSLDRGLQEYVNSVRGP